MSTQELQDLVEKIIVRVMQQIQADDELAKLLTDDNASLQDNWARTCTSYRNDVSAENSTSSVVPQTNAPVKKLYTERDIIELAQAGQKSLIVPQKTIITPAARDAAKLKGIEITVE